MRRQSMSVLGYSLFRDLLDEPSTASDGSRTLTIHSSNPESSCWPSLVPLRGRLAAAPALLPLPPSCRAAMLPSSDDPADWILSLSLPFALALPFMAVELVAGVEVAVDVPREGDEVAVDDVEAVGYCCIVIIGWMRLSVQE